MLIFTFNHIVQKNPEDNKQGIVSHVTLGWRGRAKERKG